MSTIAAIDCGTNSIRLLILRADGAQTRELTRQTRLARLGQGVDATGAFHPEALERAFAIFDEFRVLLADHHVDQVRFVATSAARDVSNKQELFDGVRTRLGVDVDVISGDEEARLSSAGVVSGVSGERPLLVIDIGGGSTELVTLHDDGVAHATSLDIGAVRVRERLLPGDPPSAAEQEAARRHVRELLDASGTPFSTIRTAVGVAGTVTSMAATVLQLTQYSRDAVHGTVLNRGQIRELASRWLSQSVQETMAGAPFMHPLRASVIGAGALIIDEISQRLPSGAVVVSETDILDGIALEMLR